MMGRRGGVLVVALLLALAGCSAFVTAEPPTATPTPAPAVTPGGSTDGDSVESPVVESVATYGGTCDRPATVVEFQLTNGGTEETRLRVVGNVHVDDATMVVDDVRVERTGNGSYELLVTTTRDPEKPSQPCAGSVGYDAVVRIPEGMHEYAILVRHDRAVAGGFGKYEEPRATPLPAA